MLLLLLACAPDAERLLALQLSGDPEDKYTLAPRRIDTLTDPLHMAGELGEVRAGGVLHLNLSTVDMEYRGGRGLEVLATAQDGVLHPLDRDGLVLFSFYGHVEDTWSAMDAVGVDIAPLFPINIAVTPAIPDIGLALLPVENAAYASTANTFILLEDLVDKEVPLAANRGVIAHETGHGIFHLLTAGDPYAPRLFGAEHPGVMGVSSLDEGFADMVAALSTDDPDFINPTMLLPERDLSGEHVASTVTSRPELEVPTLEYDPYPLGTVFASVAWDLRLHSDDPEFTLQAVCQALIEWAEAEGDSDDAEVVYLYLDHLVMQGDADWQQAACEAIGVRFADVYSPQVCP